MKLATKKYFPIVVTVLCLANVVLFNVVRQQRMAEPGVTSSDKQVPLRVSSSQGKSIRHIEAANNSGSSSESKKIALVAWNQAAGATPAPAPIPVVKVSVVPGQQATNIKISENRVLTNLTTVPITYEIKSSPGSVKVQPRVNGNLVGNAEPITQNPINATGLRENALNEIRVELKSDAGAVLATSEPLFVTVDTIGPMLQHAELVDVPNTGLTLLVNFRDGDFPPTLLPEQFQVFRQNVAGAFSDRVTPQGSPVADGPTVRLFFSTMPAGLYRLFVKGEAGGSTTNGSAATSNPLKDQLGNFAGGGTSAGKDMFWDFSVSERKFGEHIAFPPFAPPKKQIIPPEGFNPGDIVETRIARLYYYRDAHRVAEIINRNIRSFNQAAVTYAERRAQQSRDDADRSTDERREYERAAVRAAQEARSAEAKLAEKAGDIGKARELQAEIDIKTIQSDDLRNRLTASDAAAAAATTAQNSAQTASTNLIAAENLSDEKLTFANDAYYEAQTTLREQQIAEAQFRDLENNANTTPQDLNTAREKLRNSMNLASAAGNKYNKAKRDSDEAKTRADYAKRERDRLVAVYEKKAAEADAVAAATGADALKAEKARIDLEIEIKKKQKESFGSVESLTNTVKSMEQSVANLRQTELVRQETWDKSEAKEARARAKQFRDEVTSAETDPDTYVAGDMDSVDPVTQCSISVIGEGLIQLRGPIKGINKIRTMINQIDSPVGQIKIGIFSVQVNGEKGAKMEKVVGDAESNVDLSRFLVNHSLELLRKSIQTEAATIANQCEMDGHYQVDRDRRYLYSFFGRDFIDELYAMDSEFLNTENKLLSLHAMDTVSLNRALFILALAKNDVRERIVMRFLESTKTELADAEFDFRRSSELKPHTTEKIVPRWNRTHLPVTNHYHKEDIIYEAVHRNALQRYHFRNFNGFFDTGFVNPDTMNPMQREFIRLAQIFKAQLVAEMELKQRIMERGLIEDRSNDETARADIMQEVHQKALQFSRDAYLSLLETEKKLSAAAEAADRALSGLLVLNQQLEVLNSESEKFEEMFNELSMTGVGGRNTVQGRMKIRDQANPMIDRLIDLYATLNLDWFSPSESNALLENRQSLESVRGTINQAEFLTRQDESAEVFFYASEVNQVALSINAIYKIIEKSEAQWNEIQASLHVFQASISDHANSSPSVLNRKELSSSYAEINQKLETIPASSAARFVRENVRLAFDAQSAVAAAEQRIQRAEELVLRTRGSLDHRKLLNHLIDEQEEKHIELVEGTRSHIAVMDGYLKRLSIALEDDFKVQFYDPMFVRVREAARSQEVNLGQVERTTILTNNRAFAKVDPQATMEFDLPKRQIAIKEAFDAAKALVEDSGALMNDPTFLAAFQMMGGAKQPFTVKNVLPGQSLSTEQQIMGLAPQAEVTGNPGAALQSLVPEPAIYKLETGTGFQIRPVIQPDGDSVVYDFDYMYTTNIREPVRADEKHVGRIKRHFVHTAVQTGNFEIREVSRYQVALKVSRTSQGVPLLQNVPVVGAAFRPAPSAESSIQQNIILGQTNVYPTLFDLMGLRWAQQVVDLNHTSLLESEHVIRGRQESIRNHVFEESSKRVDGFLGIDELNSSNRYRPDFYYPQNLPSPHHPNGYDYNGSRVQDPTKNNFERPDRRPPEMQEPPYDRRRHQPVSPEPIGPQAVPESIPPARPRMNATELQSRAYNNDQTSSRQSALQMPSPAAAQRAVRTLSKD